MNYIPAKDFLERQKDILATARYHLQESQDRMASHYNKGRQIQKFEMGQKVLLSTANLQAAHGGKLKKKLGPKWIGPFVILEKIGTDYYRLELPPKLQLHPVFHTSLLKPDISTEEKRDNQRLFKVRLPDGEEGELVEAIVGEKSVKGKKYFKVKWLGQKDTTWEPEENVKYVQGLIDKYRQSKNVRTSKDTKLKLKGREQKIQLTTKESLLSTNRRSSRRNFACVRECHDRSDKSINEDSDQESHYNLEVSSLGNINK